MQMNVGNCVILLIKLTFYFFGKRLPSPKPSETLASPSYSQCFVPEDRNFLFKTTSLSETTQTTAFLFKTTIIVY